MTLTRAKTDTTLRSTIPVAVADICLTVCVVQPTSAAPPAGYYDTVDTTNSATLRTTLHDVIDDRIELFPYFAEFRR